MTPKIIDNFLSDSEFRLINDLLMGNNFPWYCNTYVSSEEEIKDDYYFTHQFYYNNHPNSQYYSTLLPLLGRVSAHAYKRIKGNLYPNVGKKVENGWHSDYDFSHKGAVFYVNTNNGYTELEDGTIVESIENRILFFDPSIKHRSVQCTDEKTRVTINMNYF